MVVRLSVAAEEWLEAANETDRAALVAAVEGQLGALATPLLAVATAVWKRYHDGAPPVRLVGGLCGLAPVR